MGGVMRAVIVCLPLALLAAMYPRNEERGTRNAGRDGGCDVSGPVTYKGDKIKAKKIKMDADAYCQSAHAEAVFSDEIVVGDNGGVQWAFVYIKSDALKSDPPKDAAKIDQTGCTYVPHVQGVVAGQTIKIVNSDATNHNIHALPKVNPEFNMSQKDKGMENEKVFASPEMAVRVKCDVHPWM